MYSGAHSPRRAWGPQEEKPKRLSNIRNIVLKSLQAIYFFFCFVGCTIQVKSISQIFFLYETVTELALTIPAEMDAPDLSICIRYSDIFNTSKYNAREEATEKLVEDLSAGSVRRMQQVVTIQEIFNYTPQAKSIIKQCIIRLPQEYAFREHNSTQCHEDFDVVNFYIQEYVCYRFTFRAVLKRKYQYRNLAYALAYSGMFYNVQFDSNTFRGATFMKAMVHSPSNFPYKSVSFSPNFQRKYDPVTGIAKYNRFHLSYSIITNIRQPPPYTTMCKNYKAMNFSSQNACIKNCLLNSTYSSLNKYPFSTIIIEPVAIRHVTDQDLDNQTTSDTLRNIEAKCRRDCSNPDCKDDYTLTKIVKEPQDEDMTFSVNVPMEPSYDIHHQPRMSWTEYLIYVFSCMGTWFGLSMNYMNPFSSEYFKNLMGVGQKLKGARESKGDSSKKSSKRRKRKSTSVPRSAQRYKSPKLLRERESNVCRYCSATRVQLRTEMRDEIRFLVSSMVPSRGQWPSRTTVPSSRHPKDAFC